jgi:hypothetical protein
MACSYLKMVSILSTATVAPELRLPCRLKRKKNPSIKFDELCIQKWQAPRKSFTNSSLFR